MFSALVFRDKTPLVCCGKRGNIGGGFAPESTLFTMKPSANGPSVETRKIVRSRFTHFDLMKSQTWGFQTFGFRDVQNLATL